MDIKDQFSKLIEENRLEEARSILNKLKYDANEDPFYYANSGWVLNHMERYQEAEIMLRLGIKIFPYDGWMYSQLGYCLNRQGKIKEGLVTLLNALEEGFDEPWVHGEIGWCYQEEQDYTNAIQYFENGLLDDVKNPFILSHAANVYMEVGDMKTAEEYYKKSYFYQSDHDGLRDLVNYYQRNECYQEQIAYFNQLDDKKKHDEIQYELGVAYYKIMKYENALECFLNALQLGKDDTEIRTNLADTYLALHRIHDANEQYEQALVYYEKALLHEEDTYWIYQEMIWIAHKQKDVDKKLKYLSRACEVHAMNIWFMYHYARSYSDKKEHGKAVEACVYCIAHGEDSKEIYDLYIWNLGRNHQEQEAIKQLLLYIQKFPADDWIYGELGWNYAQLNEYVKAKECFETAADINKDSIMYISMLGWCHLRLESYKEAYEWITLAQHMGRDDAWIHCVCAEIEEALGKNQEALLNYQYAIALDFEEDWVFEHMKNLEAKIKG